MTGTLVKRIDVEGFTTLNRKLRKLEDKSLAKELRGEYRTVAKKVSGTAKEVDVLPVVTGKLQRSIGPYVSGSAIGVKAGTNQRVRYAGVIHYGWPKRNIPARKFIFQAINEEEDTIESLIEAGISRILAKNGLSPGS